MSELQHEQSIQLPVTVPVKLCASEILKTTTLKQVSGSYRIVAEHDTGYCAIGVFLHEYGYYSSSGKHHYVGAINQIESIFGQYGIDIFVKTNCPICCNEVPLVNQIFHLNDHHKYTFAQIGTWLEQFEK